MASAQVVETSVNTNNSPSQDYTTNPDDHSNHNIDSPGFKAFTVIYINNHLKTQSKQLQPRKIAFNYKYISFIPPLQFCIVVTDTPTSPLGNLLLCYDLSAHDQTAMLVTTMFILEERSPNPSVLLLSHAKLTEPVERSKNVLISPHIIGHVFAPPSHVSSEAL